MKYRLKDGGIINASSPREFVRRLKESSRFDSHMADDEYLKAFAERYKLQTGSEISIDPPEIFIKSLVNSGFITDID